MKRIFVMGAVGQMCIEATRDLVQTSGYGEFLLADINEEKLKSLAKELNHRRVKILRIDASDENRVAQAIKGYDFVMDGLAFDKSGPTTRACLKCKIPTIDLGSPYRPEYVAAFKKAGVLFSTGVGMTPGVTDILAKHAVNQCDKVDEVYVNWASFRPLAISPGLVMTTFWEMNPEEKERAYYEKGKLHPQPPLKESRVVEFEPPYGPLHVYYVPHPETTTLSKLIPGVKVVKTMGTWPPIEMEFLKQIIDFGAFDKKTITHKGKKWVTLQVLADLLSQLPRGTRTALWGYALRVEVVGQKDGWEVRHILTTSHPPFEKWGRSRAYAKNVAIPMSIGTQLILNGRAKVKKGYCSAFEVFEPKEFFAELSKRGIHVQEKVQRYKKLN